MNDTKNNANWTRMLWWTLYAAAFGYIEALVVVYIRRLGAMPPGLDYPAVWAGRHLAWNGATIIAEMRRLGVYDTEYGREIATLLLLLGPAMAAGRNGRERLGLYLFTFAVWDETFYLWLKLWTGFPQSLVSTDIYRILGAGKPRPLGRRGSALFGTSAFLPRLEMHTVPWTVSLL